MAIPLRGDVIKALRNRLGLNQEQFAEKCGLSLRVLNYAESGTPVGRRTLKLIASALNVDTTALIDIEIPQDHIIADHTNFIMEHVNGLERFVDLIDRFHRMRGTNSHISLTTQELVSLARRIYGPFQPPVKKEVIPTRYEVD